LLSGLIGASANIGYFIVGILGILSPITENSWRWVMLVGAAPAALTFFIRLYVPESERWQASVRKQDARPIREVLSRPLLSRTLLAIVFASIPLVVTWGIVQWIVLWVDQMTGGTVPTAKAYVQLSLSFGAVVGSLGAPLLGLHFGRRAIYCGLCLAAFAVCSGLFRGVHAYGAAFLAMSFLVGGTTAAFYGWLPLYLPELFPTRARATGQGLSYNFGRILAAVGAWQMPTLMGWFGHSYPKAGATLVLIYLVGAAVIWVAPETRGRPLPD
jgi:MFS family permease